MRSLNRVTLMGHLAQDPELRQTAQGQAVLNFALVTNRKWKDSAGDMREQAEFHRVVAWKGLAENCSKFLKKGSPVYVEGRLTHKRLEDSAGKSKFFTEVIADLINFVGSNSGKEALV
jgi:single-strand DNA-binding protein